MRGRVFVGCEHRDQVNGSASRKLRTALVVAEASCVEPGGQRVLCL